MRKGYPAEQYYGKPADAIEEVDSVVVEGGKAEGVDEDSSFRDRRGDTLPVSVKTRDYAKETVELRESFEKKIDFVTNLWRQIESPEVADLPLPEFKYKLTQLSNDLEKVVSNSHNLRAEFEKKVREIQEINIAITSEIARERITGKAFSDGLIDILLSKRAKLSEKLRNRLNNPDFEFVHHFQAFIAGVLLKKTKIEPMRELPDQSDKMQSGLEFCRILGSFNFEYKYGYDSESPIVINENIQRLIDFLKNKASAGENIFDFIKIDPYDIVFKLDREDFDRIYISKNLKKREVKPGEENKAPKVSGVNFPSTPIVLLAIDEGMTEDDLRGVERHEKGHSLIGITEDIEGFDIHNIVYGKFFINDLRNKGMEFNNLHEKGENKKAEDIVRSYIRTAINKLNGEISADAKNIVLGYPDAIAFYIRDLIMGLNEYIAEYSSAILPGPENKIKNLFLDIVRDETRIIIAKAEDLFVKMTTYAYIARKYGLEDEFCSALVLMPDSEKYLKRVLSIKLGDKFDFVSANREIDPAKLFVGAPLWLRNGFSKYFGANSVAVG